MSLKLPFTVTCRVLVCLDEVDRQRLAQSGELCEEIFGLTAAEMDTLLTSKHFYALRTQYLVKRIPLLSLFKDGLVGRVRAYNRLLRQNILVGQRRFSKWKLPAENDGVIWEEPAFWYPLDEPSVEYWLAVQSMQKELLKHSLARQLKRRSKYHYHQSSTFLFENCSSAIASTAFTLEHQFARALLKQSLSFSAAPTDDSDSDSDSISLASIASSVQSKISFFETLAIN